MSDALTLDCGDSSCRYAKSRGGMRTNGVAVAVFDEESAVAMDYVLHD